MPPDLTGTVLCNLDWRARPGARSCGLRPPQKHRHADPRICLTRRRTGGGDRERGGVLRPQRPHRAAGLCLDRRPIDLRFPGQWFQTESGLHQRGMRDYEPMLGTYVQADPLGLVDGPSVYRYVYSNPGRYIDPRGEAGFLALFLPIVGGGTAASVPTGGAAVAVIGVDLSRFSAAPSARLGHFSFEGDGAFPA